MKTRFFSKQALILLVLLLGFSTANAFDNSPGQLKTIHAIDHERHTLVISDKVYKMPLGFKVYKIDPTVAPYRTVNRYALVVGQQVYITTSRKAGVNYVEELLIMSEQ